MLSPRWKNLPHDMSETPKRLEDINALNKKAYDAVAEEYEARKPLYMKNDPEIVDGFSAALDEGFPNTEHGQLSILDVGVGSGLNLGMFARKLYKTYGIDLSDRMIEGAKRESPQSLYYHGDFLGFDFRRKFHGIMEKAFIHLFPEGIAKQILEKTADILEDNGVFFIATTRHETSTEGVKTKDDFSDKVQRYRKEWTREEFRQFLGSIKGLKIIQESDMTDALGKPWMNFLFRKITE